ncbi:metal-dependent hydrolase [Paraclostridium bifermentans]|nr:metal-dependent hydrolase [Paraclostridium bifermentans]
MFFGTIGYASHLFLGDLFTKSGIPLFYPISEKKFSLGFLRVGGRLSNILEILFILILILCILLTLSEILSPNKGLIFTYRIRINHKI